MKVYSGHELEIYKKDQLLMKPEWNRRDFTQGVVAYINGSTEKILAIGGLRGTGKTVGILQSCEGRDDVLYILAQRSEGDSKDIGGDFIELIKNTDKRVIIIDEYSWICDRKNLDYYLLTAVQNGKRIIITATESISLEYLNYGTLNHRVHILHTTLFSYGEYLRLYDKNHSKVVCKEYLLEGGLFPDYALKNYDSMRTYIEEAIVKNLAGYLKDEMSEEVAATLTYCVLYKAICPSNLSSVPVLRNSGITRDAFLERMHINISLAVDESELRRIAEIFEQIGLIVTIPNYDSESEIKEQYYITNPSLTCQLIMAAYDLENLDNSILGHVFESCVAVQLYTNKLSEHQVFFYNNGGKQNDSENKELDIVITDKERLYAYFFECKFTQSDQIHPNITLLSGYLEEYPFKGVEVEGRYLVYNGTPCVREDYDVGPVIFTPIGYILDDYFLFEKNKKDIEKLDKDKKKDRSDGSNGGVSNSIKEIVESIAKKAEDLKSDISKTVLEQRERIRASFEHNTVITDNIRGIVR